MAEFAARDGEAFAHEDRQQRENQRRKHEENIGGDVSGGVFHAGSGIGVADADGDDESEEADGQGGDEELEGGVEELLGAEAAGEESRGHAHDGVDDEKENVGLQNPDFVATEMLIHRSLVAVGHRQSVIDQKTARLALLGGIGKGNRVL